MKPIWKMDFLIISAVMLFAAWPPVHVYGMQEDVDSVPAVKDSISRAEIIAIAEGYARHKWRASEQNVLHGLDHSGNRVDTPDSSYRKGGFVVDAENVGMPYKWGGFSSIGEFDQGIRQGKLAGHLPKKGSSPASPQAVGVDCSGLVSRCWDLPRKHSTRSLGNLCYELDSFDELQPGDIINSFDGHVVIFESFVDADRTRVAVYEAGRTRVEKSVYSVSKLQDEGFKPLRYMPLDESWVPRQLAPASFSRKPESASDFRANENGTIEFVDLKNPLLVAREGDWARYAIGNDEEAIRSVTQVGRKGVVIRNALSKSGKVQRNERTAPFDNSLLQALVDFGGFDQDFGELKLLQSQVTSGHFKQGDRTFEARRIKLDLETTLLIRQINYPVTIKVECVVSDEVPIAGMITGRFGVEVRRGNQVMGNSVKKFQLLEFYKG